MDGKLSELWSAQAGILTLSTETQSASDTHYIMHAPYRSQIMSKCGKNKKVAHKEKAECVTDLIFLPHFDMLCDLLLNRCKATSMESFLTL